MKGSTGQTLSGLRDFVLAMPFELRPKVILLENVAALDNKRAVEGHRVVTVLIKEVFDPLGYSCDWAIVSARDFYLPQHREKGLDGLPQAPLPSYLRRSVGGNRG